MSITILLVAIILLSVLAAIFWFLKTLQLKKTLKASQASMSRKIYELAILKELGERTGYSLNVEKIIDIITGSLSQFIEYSTVAYMLLEPEQVVFKVHLEKSVSRSFVDDIEDRMLKSLSALLNREYTKDQVSEILSGAILVDEVNEPVRSFFNIPLVIGGKVVGVLTVAHSVPGLYKEEEMTILYKITQQAASAVSRLEEVVEFEEQKLNAMVASMAEGVVMTDNDFHVVVANPAAKSIIGLDKSEPSIFDFIDGLSGSFDIRGKLEESVRLDKVLISDVVSINNHFYQIIVSPVKNLIGHKKEILGGVVIFHDITEEKEAENMREDFTSMMVHELRSPLDGIKKIIELLRSPKSKLPKKSQTEYLQIVYGSSSQMLELVNDLLDVAKLESGKFEIEPVTSNIIQVINDRVSFYKTLANDKKINLSFCLAKNLDEQVLFDPGRISQVLNNLISNALKFTNTGGNVTVEVFSHHALTDVKSEIQAGGLTVPFYSSVKDLNQAPDSLVVCVVDNGVGIAKNKMLFLFNKYKQFRATAESEIRGTGLGLAIVKGIVEAHNGIIGVDSEEGKGSIFYFTIPTPKANTK